MTVLLKTPDEIKAMQKSGELSAAVLRAVGELCKPGISTLELDSFAEEFIVSHGGIPTFKGYGGFPGTICASVNEAIVHGIPSRDVILQKGDIISIDVGATVDGWAGDNAATFAVGSIDEDSKRLLAGTAKALQAGIAQAKPGNYLGDIGHAISLVAAQYDLGVVRDYTGHGIGRDMHEDPAVPNYGNPHQGLLLQPGMVLAIEPMFTLGKAKTKVSKDGWLVTTKDRSRAAHFENTIAVTEGEPLIVSKE